MFWGTKVSDVDGCSLSKRPPLSRGVAHGVNGGCFAAAVQPKYVCVSTRGASDD